jgi:hypothetical protein
LTLSLGLTLGLGLLLAACGPAATGPAGGAGPTATPQGSRAVTGATGTSSVPTAAQTSAPTAGVVDVYRLPEGPWAGQGSLRIEVAGGYSVVLELPLAGGTTAAGRTILTFERTDPGDSRWSLGRVRLSFFPQADSVGIEAGGLVVQGPCNYALGTIEIGKLGGELTCNEVQAAFQGDPREVTIRGSFTASR